MAVIYHFLFTHKCRSSKFLGVWKIFARISPNLPEKLLGHFLCIYFLVKTFLGWPPKKVFMWFCKRWTPFFSNKSNHVGHHFWPYFRGVCPDILGFCECFHRFLRILPGFSPIQNIWGCSCTPASYTSFTGKNVLHPKHFCSHTVMLLPNTRNPQECCTAVWKQHYDPNLANA